MHHKKSLHLQLAFKSNRLKFEGRGFFLETTYCLHGSVPLHAFVMFIIESFLAFAEDQMATSKKKGPVENQPVTFKTKIKSSGYTVTPRLVNISFFVATYLLSLSSFTCTTSYTIPIPIYLMLVGDNINMYVKLCWYIHNTCAIPCVI